jgi:hypothetical protein
MHIKSFPLWKYQKTIVQYVWSLGVTQGDAMVQSVLAGFEIPHTSCANPTCYQTSRCQGGCGMAERVTYNGRPFPSISQPARAEAVVTGRAHAGGDGNSDFDDSSLAGAPFGEAD